MMKKTFDSTTVRTILIILTVILTAGLVGGYFYVQDKLSGYASEVGKTTSELAAKENTEKQAGLDTALAQYKPSVDKAAAFVAPSGSYLGIVTSDLRKYASETGVELSDISPAQAPAIQVNPGVIGLQTSYVKVTIKNPASFTGLMEFINGIETNLPKMQLTGINLTHASGDADRINVDPLIIKVYIK
jgi:hypothetical protein